uniref:Uncharacterized protein n=1 Tax=Salix viminalis TaxID=40686 RepID=A0A6N2LEF5_SALVM
MKMTMIMVEMKNPWMKVSNLCHKNWPIFSIHMKKIAKFAEVEKQNEGLVCLRIIKPKELLCLSAVLMSSETLHVAILSVCCL